jgi:hypothetical protein
MRPVELLAAIASRRLWDREGRADHHQQKDNQRDRNQKPFVSGHQSSPQSTTHEATPEWLNVS